jgi:hypothetical protein
VDNLTWWEVDYNDLIGWTAEGSGNDYLLEPATSAAGSNIALPSDLISGISFTGGAGHFPLVTCAVFVGPGDYAPIITEGTAIYASDNFTFEAIELPNEQTIESSFFPTYDAAVCTDHEPETITVTAPNGDLWHYNWLWVIFEGVEIRQYHLPFEAYAIPGTWTLTVDDLTVYVDIPQRTEPTRRYLERDWLLRDDDKFMAILVGYQPNEQIGLITFEGDVLVVTADANGNAIVEFPNDTYSISAIVPESGQSVELVIENAPIEMVEEVGISVGGERNGIGRRFRIPPDISRQLLYDAFWGAGAVDLTAWTCPGGLLPRLNAGGLAMVISDGLYLRESPDVDTQILTEAPTGTIIEVGSGVECGESGTTWWEVRYDGVRGWSAESRDGTYFMESLD